MIEVVSPEMAREYEDFLKGGRAEIIGDPEAVRLMRATHIEDRRGTDDRSEGERMIGAPISEDSLTLYGSFTSSSSYKSMLYLALAGLPFSFRTVNLKIGVQSTPEYLAINRWGVVP